MKHGSNLSSFEKRRMTCARKVRHTIMRKALNAQAEMEKRGKRVGIYECAICDGWHLTHLKSAGRK
jgi:inner membrane protein involved in colicin E2 resistance